MAAEIIDHLRSALAADDAATVRALLASHPGIRARVDEPAGPFDTPAICHARSRAMLDVLLEAGADINARSRWWAGGFGLLDSAAPDLAEYAIARGARVDVHAAARLGMLDRLRELLTGDPSLVHARGGDGQTPLHVASTVEIAAFLLGEGANIDARDVDHESTPVQYMVETRQEVARFLVSRGCRTDLLLAAALGDVDLARRHLDADPAFIRIRVSDEFFPMADPRAGGTIYQWTLGFHVSPHQVARRFQRDAVLALLVERSPPEVALADACWSGDRARAQRVLREQPDLASRLPPGDRRLVADAARNNATAAVELMLECGWPVEARGQHDATPLHWAAFHGNAAMAAGILRIGPPLDAVDRDFNGTPLQWAVHGSEHGWHARTGDYAATVEALLAAGAPPPAEVKGSAAVRDVLRRARGI